MIPYFTYVEGHPEWQRRLWLFEIEQRDISELDLRNFENTLHQITDRRLQQIRPPLDEHCMETWNPTIEAFWEPETERLKITSTLKTSIDSIESRVWLVKCCALVSLVDKLWGVVSLGGKSKERIMRQTPWLFMNPELAPDLTGKEERFQSLKEKDGK